MSIVDELNMDEAMKDDREAEAICQAALEELRVPSELREVAAAFDRAGRHGYAECMRRRAALCEMGPLERKALREAFHAALGTADPKKMHAAAAMLEEKGAVHAAAALRELAKPQEKTP